MPGKAGQATANAIEYNVPGARRVGCGQAGRKRGAAIMLQFCERIIGLGGLLAVTSLLSAGCWRSPPASPPAVKVQPAAAAARPAKAEATPAGDSVPEEATPVTDPGAAAVASSKAGGTTLAAPAEPMRRVSKDRLL